MTASIHSGGVDTVRSRENFIGGGRLPTWPSDGEREVQKQNPPTCFPQLDYYQSKRLAKRWITREFATELPPPPKKTGRIEQITRKRITAIINLLEAEDVFHVVEAGGLVAGPDGGTKGAVGEGVSARGLVGKFESFTVPGVDHGVVTDDIAAAEGMHANLAVGALADDAFTAVANLFLK